MAKNRDFSPCVVIPTYNHSEKLEDILDDLYQKNIAVIVINDGSNHSHSQAIERICKKYEHQVDLICFEHNKGKGGAVIEGLQQAYQKGFSHALQLDADGQHDRSFITSFFHMAEKHPRSLIQGQPVYDETAPKSRKYGRLINHIWVCIETLTTQIIDSMCGFRIYPLHETIKMLKRYKISHNMDFDTDIYVHLRWQGVSVMTKDVKVVYWEGNLSNFKGLRDNIYISLGHTKRVFKLLLTFPFKYKALKASKNIDSDWNEKQELGSPLGIKIVFGLYRLLGRKICLFFVRVICLYYFLTQRKVCKNLNEYLHNLKNSGHYKKKISYWDSYHIIYNFAVSILDRGLSWMLPQEVQMNTTSKTKEILKNIIKDNKGAIFIGAHMGVLDISRSRGFSVNIPPINVFYYGVKNDRFVQFVKENTPKGSFNYIETKDFDMNSVFELQEKMDKGEWLFCAGDRILSHDKKSVIKVPFLGKEAYFPTGPFLMSKLFDCPIYTIINIRPAKPSLDNPQQDYEIHVEPLIKKVDFSRMNREEKLREYAQQYSLWLEEKCTQNPHYWFNFHSFWKPLD